MLILVRGVGNKVIYTNKYAVIKIFVKRTINSKPTKGLLTIKAHLVDNLRANLLISNNTLRS